MAGPWLKYRGHLDNISNNCLIGAINAFNIMRPIRSNLNVGMKACLLWPEPTKPRALAQWSLAMKTMEKARPGHAAMEPSTWG